jgi:hypothetical protein
MRAKTLTGFHVKCALQTEKKNSTRVHSKVHEKAQTPHSAMEKSIRNKRKQVYIKTPQREPTNLIIEFQVTYFLFIQMLFPEQTHQPTYNSDNPSSTITQFKRRDDSLMSTIQYWLNQGPRLRPLTTQSFLTTYVAKEKFHIHLVAKQMSP